MRVTDRMIFDAATLNSGRAQERAQQATQVATTGVRVVHPGDDPAAAALVSAERGRVTRLDAIATATGRASDELAAADGALDEVGNLISRARELAVQLSTSTYDAADRAAGAKEVQGIIQSVVASLNVKVGNRYVLAGNADGAPPFAPVTFDALGNVDPVATGAYAGDAGVRQVEIAPGVLQDASVRADVAMKGAGGGVDVLATLAALANALSANDPVATSATLTNLTAGTTQLASARGQAGASMAALDAAAAANKTARDDAKVRIGNLADADTIQAASELALAQRALDAALTASAKSFQLSLLNKL
ncbi:MAG: flagellar biosynthesis protein FlgL [Anaeromyxobacter sp.]